MSLEIPSQTVWPGEGDGVVVQEALSPRTTTSARNDSRGALVDMA
jgi:hypothetical protein